MADHNLTLRGHPVTYLLPAGAGLLIAGFGSWLLITRPGFHDPWFMVAWALFSLAFTLLPLPNYACRLRITADAIAQSIPLSRRRSWLVAWRDVEAWSEISQAQLMWLMVAPDDHDMMYDESDATAPARRSASYPRRLFFRLRGDPQIYEVYQACVWRRPQFEAVTEHFRRHCGEPLPQDRGLHWEIGKKNRCMWTRRPNEANRTTGTEEK